MLGRQALREWGPFKISTTQMIMLGEADVVVAGGMENLSRAPHVLRGMGTLQAREAPSAGEELAQDMEDYLFTNLVDGVGGMFMAQTSDELCRGRA